MHNYQNIQQFQQAIWHILANSEQNIMKLFGLILKCPSVYGYGTEAWQNYIIQTFLCTSWQQDIKFWSWDYQIKFVEQSDILWNLLMKWLIYWPQPKIRDLGAQMQKSCVYTQLETQFQ